MWLNVCALISLAKYFCDASVVTIPNGDLRGTTTKATNDVMVDSFYAIPYAKPPVGMFYLASQGRHSKISIYLFMKASFICKRGSVNSTKLHLQMEVLFMWLSYLPLPIQVIGVHVDSNPDLSQQPGSTRLSGRFNPIAEIGA